MTMLRFATTRHGVMVQVHVEPPSDEDWAAMMKFLVERGRTIKSMLVISKHNGGPSSKQRNELAAVLAKHLPQKLSVAVLTDSRVTRGIVTAITWMTGRAETTAAFPLDALEKGMDFIHLTPEERSAARELIRQLESSTAAAASGAR